MAAAEAHRTAELHGKPDEISTVVGNHQKKGIVNKTLLLTCDLHHKRELRYHNCLQMQNTPWERRVV